MRPSKWNAGPYYDKETVAGAVGPVLGPVVGPADDWCDYCFNRFTK
jgi:hypothetical protein